MAASARRMLGTVPVWLVLLLGPVRADRAPVSDLARSVAAVGSTPATLHITQPVTVQGDLTVPDNITLSVERGGMLDLSPGATLTVNGSIDAGTYQILRGTGRIAGDLKVEEIYPEWFCSGAYDAQDCDWAPAINQAIALASSGCLKVKLQCRRYNVSSTVDLTSSSGVHRAGMCLEGAIRSTQYERGTLLIGNTGEGKCVIETSDSDGIHLRNVGVIRGTANPSSIGILQGRATSTQWAGDQYHENVYVNMGSNPSSNGGFGTIGIVNIAGEETKWHNLQVWANLPLIISMGSGGGNDLGKLQRTRGDFSGTDSCTIASSVGQSLTQQGSNTVFEMSGLGRLIAYDFVSPCLLLNTAADVNLGHTFMQLRASGAQGVAPGKYRYAIENWNVWQLAHQGNVEGSSGYLLNRRGLFSANVTATLAGSGETTLPVIYLFDDDFDGHFYHSTVLNSSFTLFSYDENRPLVASRRMDGDDNAPMYFSIRNCVFRTQMPLNMATVADKRILRKTFDTTWQFRDGSMRVGHNAISMDISRNLGKGHAVTDLVRIHMPAAVDGVEAFAVTVGMEGALSTAPGAGSPSVTPVTAQFSAVSAGKSVPITVSQPGIAAGQPTDSDPRRFSIGGLRLTAVADSASNSVVVKGQPSCGGSDAAEVYLNCTVTLRWSGGGRETVLVERL